MLGLRQYKDSDYNTIKNWCRDELTFYRWTAGVLGEYPLTEEKFSFVKNNFPFTFFDETGPVGFLMMRTPGSDISELRFGFVIVDPDKRGKGYGRKMIETALRYATKVYGAKKVTIGVFKDNTPALSCYLASGFKQSVTKPDEKYSIMGKQWNCLELEFTCEYLDIVDEKGNPTGEICERKAAHLCGVMHRTSHVWLIRKKDGRTQILLQKRCTEKDSFPGCYDISSAGHIPAGCGFEESAVRELSEELGVSADASELVFSGDRVVFWDDCFRGIPYHDRQYSRVFLLLCDRDEKDFSLQKEEIDDVKWMNFEDCYKAVSENSINHCIALEELDMVKSTLSHFNFPEV